MRFLKSTRNKPEIRKRLKKSAKYLNLRRKRRIKSSLENLKAVTRRYSSYFRHLVIAFFVLSTMYALYEIIFFSSFFKVKNITLNGDFNYVSYTDISQVINSATLGRSIFTISSYDLSELLSKNFLAARRIQVKKKIPSSLIITIEERVPVAVVNKQEGEETFIVDNDGFVLGIADERFDTFPQVEYGEDILVGKFLDKNLIPLSMEIIKDANDNDLQISSMSFSENYVTVYLEPNFIVYLDSGDVVSKSMSVVAALVKKLVLEGKTVSKIDLRYDKVVVSY